MKQTAVEWLEQLLFNKQGKFTKGDIEQAKEMEKQQQAYSDEDMIEFGKFIFKNTLLVNIKGVDGIFEQFKNK